MTKITRVNIAAARAQRDILRRSGREVPAHVERLATTQLADPENSAVLVKERQRQRLKQPLSDVQGSSRRRRYASKNKTTVVAKGRSTSL
ncbi:hypothetical protein [Arthrobacter pigmenti]